jgi:ATP-dependent RNA helicase DDX19/DBP5
MASPAPASEFSDLLGLQGRDEDSLRLIRGDTESALYPDLPWEQLVANTDVQQGLYDLGFEAPSRVQCQALQVLTGASPRSLVAQAPSGSGKTIAFVTSMLLRVDPYVKKLQAICLANTLELVRQTFEVCQSVNAYTQFSLGWTARETFQGEGDVQVLVGTPSAVQSALSPNRKSGQKLDASDVRILIIDEADELVKPAPPMQRGCPPLKNTFRKTIDGLIKSLPANIPIGFFSASFSDESIKTIKEWRPDVLEMRKKEVPKEIRHFYYVAKKNQETEAVTLLVGLARQRFLSQGIIFLARKDQPEAIAKALTRSEERRVGKEC